MVLFFICCCFALFPASPRPYKKYTAMLQDNVGDLEYFDLRWSSILLFVLFVVQLLWAIESLSQQTWFSASVTDRNLLFDTCYCFLALAFVVFVKRKIILQQVFVMNPEENEPEGSETPVEKILAADTHDSYHKVLLLSNIEEVIHEKKYYLETDLTLQKLAKYLGTNRQYLSNYINQEKHKTFYDYINDFRLEEAKRLLDSENDDQSYSMEEIAALSGYNSYTTFLRSFKKKYGQSPTNYLRDK